MPTPTGRKSTKTKESFSRTSRHTYSSRVPPGATSGPAVKGEIDQSMRSTYIDRRSACAHLLWAFDAFQPPSGGKNESAAQRHIPLSKGISTWSRADAVS